MEKTRVPEKIIEARINQLLKTNNKLKPRDAKSRIQTLQRVTLGQGEASTLTSLPSLFYYSLK